MTLPRNRAVDRVNLHYGLQAFADGLGGVFVLAYLLRAGVSLTATLVVFAVLLAGRFVIRPAVLPFARRWGLRPALIVGALLTAASFPLLTLVHGIGPPLAAYCLVSSFGGVFYWTCFHAYFAAVGDARDRGRQIGVREALATALGIVAPAMGGWALVAAGPRWTFSAVGLIHALAGLPLIGAPDVAIGPPRRAPSAPRRPACSSTSSTAHSRPATSICGRSPFSCRWARASRPTAGRWRWRRWSGPAAASSLDAMSMPGTAVGRSPSPMRCRRR
jgi:MFS family permease